MATRILALTGMLVLGMGIGRVVQYRQDNQQVFNMYKYGCMDGLSSAIQGPYDPAAVDAYCDAITKQVLGQ